jgi:Tfp pilus assembly protein PilP
VRALTLFIVVAIAPTVGANQEPQTAEGYPYQTGGRRDPFVSLLGVGETRAPLKRGEGLAALAVGEIAVRGVLQSRGGARFAMIQGPDKKTYLVHSGDKLADGTIMSITSQGLVIAQDVNDPRSPVKQHEIRKSLRQGEDPKQ